MQKPILLPNLKKCSKGNTPLSLLDYLGIGTSVVSLILWSGRTYGAETDLLSKLKTDIQSRKTASFSEMLRHWEENYGTSAFHPLLKIASDKQNKDPDRYIALMSAAKLGGTDSAPLFVPFLADSSWMIRSGTLRALAALGNKSTAEAALPLLHDPALVVRTEAVETIRVLQPKGAAVALLSTLEDEANYHGGKALWVPKKALQALVAIQAKETAPKLIPILRRQTDPEILIQTVQTLEALTGRKSDPNLALSEQITRWTKIPLN